MDYIASERFQQLKDRYEQLYQAVVAHWQQRGHERCWENDVQLYRAAGLEPGDPQRPSIAEHRQFCDQYRAELYQVPVSAEPCALIRLLQDQVQQLQHEKHRLLQELVPHRPVVLPDLPAYRPAPDEG